MSKDYPSGFKKRKSKPRIPVPPPGGPHGGRDEYKRSRDREVEKEMVEEGLENKEECPKCGNLISSDKFVDHVVDCSEYKALDAELDYEEDTWE